MFSRAQSNFFKIITSNFKNYLTTRLPDRREFIKDAELVFSPERVLHCFAPFVHLQTTVPTIVLFVTETALPRNSKECFAKNVRQERTFVSSAAILSKIIKEKDFCAAIVDLENRRAIVVKCCIIKKNVYQN